MYTALQPWKTGTTKFDILGREGARGVQLYPSEKIYKFEVL